MKKPEQFTVGIEVGADGYRAGWCLDLPGCYALLRPGAEPIECMGRAILEFLVWSHNRSAERVDLTGDSIELVQTITTGLDLSSGDGAAFFLHDLEPAGGKEFPQWANAHDLAMDEIRALALTLPAGLLQAAVDGQERTMLDIVVHAATTERWYAQQLAPANTGGAKPGIEGALRLLGETHALLQQVVCDVPPTTRARRETSMLHGPEDWSVRKVMRRSIQHLRYHTWELRRALSGIWLA
jgi:hypothetical protein